MQVIGPHCTSRILEDLTLRRGFVEPGKGIGGGCRRRSRTRPSIEGAGAAPAWGCRGDMGDRGRVYAQRNEYTRLTPTRCVGSR